MKTIVKMDLYQYLILLNIYNNYIIISTKFMISNLYHYITIRQYKTMKTIVEMDLYQYLVLLNTYNN